VKAVSDVINHDIFDGKCSAYRWINHEKFEAGNHVWLAQAPVLQNWIEGKASYSNVASWFGSFANVITKLLRFQTGADFLNTTAVNQVQTITPK
jgi:hypothetical protein